MVAPYKLDHETVETNIFMSDHKGVRITGWHALLE